ncbi:hypothetical protein CYMTET_40502 [Cymbomonas tetramitiformis]|uniref:Glycosyltransferase 61 catalytic domain-containing protein n=1 Tax=Cymbomonas tetramitiformis TaxID=36881 RepID=A0AAE0C7W9_9CHLO|nr:hypothetical protein CYMTET_40502 [Cymbomonas tetramitiformis]
MLQAISGALAPDRNTILSNSSCDATLPNVITFTAASGVLHPVYGHFLIDGCFVFWLVATEWQKSSWSPPVVLLPESSSPFTQHFGALFGNDLVVEVREVDVAAVRRAAIVKLHSVGAGFTNISGLRGDLQAFRAFGWQRLLGAAPGTPSTLTFIVRGRSQPGTSGSKGSCEGLGHGAERRFIENEAEVHAYLRLQADATSLAFKRVVLEDCTLAEQCAVFASSGLLVAQHGSGLANVVWMQPGTSVIEIGAPAVVNCFKSLADSCGVSWYPSSMPGPWKGGLVVSLEELADTFHQASNACN